MHKPAGKRQQEYWDMSGNPFYQSVVAAIHFAAIR
jgi:hypothetical protein